MNPTSQIAQKGLNLVKGIVGSHEPESRTPAASVKPEVVNYIPVKKQDQLSQTSTPAVTSAKPFIEETAKTEDKELDGILKDVNSQVKSSDKKFALTILGREKTAKKVGVKSQTKQRKPLLAIALAIVVATALSLTAFFVFSGSQFFEQSFF